MASFNWGDLLALGTALAWSLAVLFYRWGTDRVGVVPLKVFHNSVATVFLFLCLPLFGQPWLPNLSYNEWLLVAGSAIIGITLADTWHVAAIKRIGASGQALLDCLYAPSVIVLAYYLYGETFSPWGWLGSGLILISIFIANDPESSLIGNDQGQVRPATLDFKNQKLGIFYGVLSQLAMALCVVMIRDILIKDSVFAITAYRYLIGSVILVGFAWPKLGAKELFSAFKINSSLGYSFSGTFFGPFMATLLWFSSFKYTTAGRAAIYSQFATIFIIILARIFLKENLSARKIFAVAVAVIGGYMVSLS